MDSSSLPVLRSLFISTFSSEALIRKVRDVLDGNVEMNGRSKTGGGLEAIANEM